MGDATAPGQEPSSGADSKLADAGTEAAEEPASQDPRAGDTGDGPQPENRYQG